jgi:hypothetical protein
VAVLAQVKDKAGRQHNATWSKFGSGQLGIFYNSHTKKLYFVDPVARLPVAVENLPIPVQQDIRWAAQDAGVAGNLELHLRRRYNAKRPLLIPFHYGEGFDAVANARVVLPLSSVAPADRQAFIEAGVEWSRQWNLVLLEQKKIAAITAQIYHDAGGEFNLNSPKQLGTVLFEKLKLPAVKKTKTGYSTDDEVLTRLADQLPVPAKKLCVFRSFQCIWK